MHQCVILSFYLLILPKHLMKPFVKQLIVSFLLIRYRFVSIFPKEMTCKDEDYENVKDKYWKAYGESKDKESKDQEEEHQDVEVEVCAFAGKNNFLTALLLRKGVELALISLLVFWEASPPHRV